MFLARVPCALRALVISAAVLLSAGGCVTAEGQSAPASPAASPAGGSPAIDQSRAPSEASASSQGTAAASADPAPAASGTTPTGALELTETAKGQTLTVAVGASIKVTLHSTYWTIAQGSPAGVLALVAPPVYSAAGTVSCIPGTGCGTVTATFRALSAGRATITATRTSCGEAIACVGGSGTFDVTVIVQP
jgi:hypothetical protein